MKLYTLTDNRLTPAPTLVAVSGGMITATEVSL